MREDYEMRSRRSTESEIREKHPARSWREAVANTAQGYRVQRAHDPAKTT